MRKKKWIRRIARPKNNPRNCDGQCSTSETSNIAVYQHFELDCIYTNTHTHTNSSHVKLPRTHENKLHKKEARLLRLCKLPFMPVPAISQLPFLKRGPPGGKPVTGPIGGTAKVAIGCRSVSSEATEGLRVPSSGADMSAPDHKTKTFKSINRTW